MRAAGTAATPMLVWLTTMLFTARTIVPLVPAEMPV